MNYTESFAKKGKDFNMNLMVKQGIVDNLAIINKQGGKFSSVNASFKLRGNNIEYNFRDMPMAASSPDDDTIKIGDEIIISYKISNKVNKIQEILSIKNLRNGEFMGSDMLSLYVILVSVPLVFCFIIFEAYSDFGFNKFGIFVYIISMSIILASCIPSIFEIKIRRRANYLVNT